MTKKHIFTIAVDIDDEAIRNGIINGVEKQVVEGIKEELFEKDHYGRRKKLSDRFMDKLMNVVKDLVDENKEFIIQEVIKIISEKVYRSKHFKDSMDKCGADMRERKDNEQSR